MLSYTHLKVCIFLSCLHIIKNIKELRCYTLAPLVNSGYYDLDKLEKDLIKKYNSYEKGCNKTNGNGY